MTVTEAPAEPAVAAEPTPRSAPLSATESLLSTGDHKSVGRTWVAFSLVFLVGTAVAGVLSAAERIDTSSSNIVSDHGLATYSAYRVGGVLLVVLPLFIGIATAIVPLQIGSRAVAFPRAAAGALWTWLIGAALMIASVFANGGPGGTDADATDLWLVSLGLVLTGLVVATTCLVTTVITLRTPDMTLDRVPPFTWSMLVAGVIWLLTLPIAFANLIFVFVDHHYGQTGLGAPDQLWGHFLWLFDQPAIYMVAIPALGVLVETVPVVAGRLQRHAAALAWAVACFGILSFGAYAQPALSIEFVDSIPYVGAAFLIGLPVLVVVGGAADTIKRGKLQMAAPAVLAVIAVDLLLLAALLGALAVIGPLDLLGTTWQSAHSDLVWVVGLSGALAALLWWAPKLWGRRIPTVVGYALTTLLLVGGVLLTLPQAIAGALDQPIYGDAFEVRDGVEGLNTVAAIGALIVALAALVAGVAVLQAFLGRPRDDDDAGPVDPWDGQTLEWSTPSPPPPDNFPDGVPVVTSATPLSSDEPAEEEAS